MSEQNNWIDVKKQEPPDRYVLVCDANDVTCMIGTAKHTGEGVFDSPDWMGCQAMTHWQELPVHVSAFEAN